MDPFTVTVLAVLAVIYMIRRGTEDVMSIATGNDSPRVERFKIRRAENRLTVVEALNVRLARFIVQGRDRSKPPGPFRMYASELWTGSWESARRYYVGKRARRQPADGDQPAPAVNPNVDDTDIVDAEVVDTDTWDDPWDWAAETDDDHTDTSAPDPAQEPLRKETPMTSPTTVTVPGEVTSPRQALAWADANLDTNNQVADQLHYLVTYLKGAGLGPAALATVGAVLTAADGFTSAARGAQGVYAEHVLIHQDLSSDPALRDTLRGYLDAAHV